MWRTRVGYAGGTTRQPTYRNIGDHAETLEIDYDPAVIGYDRLLEVYWTDHLPDRPVWTRQYASIIFVRSAEEQRLAQASLETLEARHGRLHAEILPAGRFWVAEDYHQKYYLRGHSALLRDVAAMHRNQTEFMNSTVAARLNGYLGGHGTPEQLAEELPDLGLSPASSALLQRMVVRRHRLL